MAYDYSDLVDKTRNWVKQATASGWINADAASELSQLETRTPENLLLKPGQSSAVDSRPLIVAFMGGTGVGKSSLLNRLAGKAIAKAGIVRPTSREVTLYHHERLSMEHLPEQLPLSKITISQHDDAKKGNVVWIDMPDFDSTELSNKQLVLQWLPYIDLLIYVVSPERYRDEKAWRLLLAEGARHAWLFVFNQWDRARLEQYEDFNRQLLKAGFVDPIIFKTVCAEAMKADDFSALESTIVSLATEHSIAQLEQRSLRVRKLELRDKLQKIRGMLGSEQDFQKAPELWQNQWQRTVKYLLQGFEWPIKSIAAYYAEHAADLISGSASASPSLWDAWAQARFDDALDEFIISLDQLDIPVTPLKQRILEVRDKAHKIMRTQTELASRQALANPGNVFQRVFLKFIRLCELTLPLMAMAWVGYRVFMVYYTSNMLDTQYLGVHFAIHSSLLIAMTWLIPYFILKKTQPSLEKTVIKGLNKGIASAFSIIESDVLSVIDSLLQQHEKQLKELSGIIDDCSAVDEGWNRAVHDNSPLQRMLVN